MTEGLGELSAFKISYISFQVKLNDDTFKSDRSKYTHLISMQLSNFLFKQKKQSGFEFQ